MERKSLSGVTVKDAAKGIVQAAFCTFDVIDLDGDVTRKTAFKDGTAVRVSAYNHGSWEGALPVGKGVVRVAGNQAICDMQFFMGTQHGRDTFEVVKEMGDLQEYSWGFNITDAEPGEVEGKSVRIIKSVDIHEVSPVLLGAAGPGRTRTLAVKSYRDGGYEALLKRTFTQDEREAAARAGHAMDDGSYPIENVEDLRRAIRAVGRGGADHDVIRRHIIRQARRLNAANLIPDNWNRDGSIMDDSAKGRRLAVRGPIPYTETETLTRAWDGAATVKGLAEDARPSQLRSVFAWVDPDGDPEAVASYKMAHHHGVDGPANLRACLQGIAELNGARGDSGIPDDDREAVYKHLAAHLSDADRDVPELLTDGSQKGRQRFADQAIDVMANVSSLIDRATEVMAFRAQKGKGMSQGSADLLGWIADDLKRLNALLATSVENDEPEGPTPEEKASLFVQSLALINDF